MSRKSNNPRFVYPMSKLASMLSAEEVERFSKNYVFSEDDKYFHFDEDKEFLESLNDEDINFYNKNVPTNEVLLMVAYSEEKVIRKGRHESVAFFLFEKLVKVLEFSDFLIYLRQYKRIACRLEGLIHSFIRY